MGRVGGQQLIGAPGPVRRRRPAHDRAAGRARRGGRAVGGGPPLGRPRPTCEIGLDLTFRARTLPYGLRRGTMRAGDDVVWDQSHILQSGHLHRHVHRRRHHPRRSTAGSASATTRGASATTAAARCGCGSRSSSTTASSACGTGSCPNGAPRLHRRLLGRHRRRATRSRWSTSTTTWPGSTRQGGRSTTASTARTSPGLAGPVDVHLADGRTITVEAEGTLRPALRAVPPGRAQPDAWSAPTTAATAPPSTRSPARATTATSRSPGPRISPSSEVPRVEIRDEPRKLSRRFAFTEVTRPPGG